MSVSGSVPQHRNILRVNPHQAAQALNIWLSSTQPASGSLEICQAPKQGQKKGVGYQLAYSTNFSLLPQLHPTPKVPPPPVSICDYLTGFQTGSQAGLISLYSLSWSQTQNPPGFSFSARIRGLHLNPALTVLIQIKYTPSRCS